jgi:hypothetical protein
MKEDDVINDLEQKSASKEDPKAVAKKLGRTDA